MVIDDRAAGQEIGSGWYQLYRILCRKVRQLITINLWYRQLTLKWVYIGSCTVLRLYFINGNEIKDVLHRSPKAKQKEPPVGHNY